MATTQNLQSTVNWTLPHLRYQPVQLSGNQPALDYGNIIMQTILGPPMKWPWNRSYANFLTNPGLQDYPRAVPNYGFIEGASVIANKPYELTTRQVLQLDGNQERPAYIAPQLDDGQGNITFRLSPSPDSNYSTTITLQNKPPMLTSLASLWTPIPDELMYIVNFGFLALCSLLTNDARFQVFNQRFLAHLLGRQGGLDDQEKNIFIGNWLALTGQLQGSALSKQQSVAARQA